MTTTVYTESVCDKCGSSDRRKGNVAGVPSGWAYIQWHDRGRVDYELCSHCASEVKMGLPEKPKVETMWEATSGKAGD